MHHQVAAQAAKCSVSTHSQQDQLPTCNISLRFPFLWGFPTKVTLFVGISNLRLIKSGTDQKLTLHHVAP